MPTPKQKAKSIDELNEAFIQVGIAVNKRTYNAYYNKVLKELTKPRKRELTSKQVRKIINDTPINDRGYKKQVYNSMVLSGIQTTIENQRLDKEDMSFLAPILLITRFYGNKPQLLASKTDKMVTSFISGNKSNLNNRDKKIYPQFESYFKKNKKTINKMLTNANKSIKKIHRSIKSTTSKRILKVFKKEANTKVTEFVFKDGKKQQVTRFQTFDEVRVNTRKQFDSEIDWRVNRMLDTEIKTLQEETKLTQHIGLGYTHKTWRTQLDKKVRQTHRKLEGKTKPIDKKFRVGAGWGMYPGDPNLPPKERINERCTLVMIKRS